jgi:hypothetical protein
MHDQKNFSLQKRDGNVGALVLNFSFLLTEHYEEKGEKADIIGVQDVKFFL